MVAASEFEGLANRILSVSRIPSGTDGAVASEIGALEAKVEPTMHIRYYLDEETGQPHLYRHGLSEEEVEDVLARPGEDRPGREGARIAMGQTRSGRYLRVVYVPDPEPESVFVITGYELRGKPLVAYKRRVRRRQ